MSRATRRIFRAFVVAVCSAVSACYSFGVTRHTLDVSNGTQRTSVRVWVQEKAPLADCDDGWALAPVAVVLSYPINVIVGIVYGVKAPFDARHDVRFGPLGWLVGAAVPGCTLAGPLKQMNAEDVELDAASYEQFVAALRAGDGRAAVRTDLRSEWFPIDPDRVLDVAVAPADEPLTSSPRWRPRR